MMTDTVTLPTALVEALEPFLAFLYAADREGEGENPDSDPLVRGYQRRITFGDFRNLRLALTAFKDAQP